MKCLCKISAMLLLVCVVGMCMPRAMATSNTVSDEMGGLIEQVEELWGYSYLDDWEKTGRALWDLFLESPEDFAAAILDHEWSRVRKMWSCMEMCLRSTEYRKNEIGVKVRSLDLLAMAESQQWIFFWMIFDTENAQTLKIENISAYNYPLLFGKMRYMDGWVGPFYATHIQTVFTLDPVAYIAALSKEPREDWDRLAMGTAYAYEFEDDFVAFRETLSNLSKEERSEAEREVIALLQKHCENRTSLLPGSNPDMPPKTADAFDGIAAVLVMGLSGAVCVTLIRKKRYA